MLKAARQSLLAVGMLVSTPAVRADDVAQAAKLVGVWEGRWEFANAGGKVVVKITSSSGNSLKGESTWYDTAVGDFSDRFTGAKVKEGKLKVSEQTMDFEVTVSEDGMALAGTWTSPMASGPLRLKKKASS
jgi:hypothetical protein